MTGLETTTEAYILRDLCMRNLPTCISLGVKGPVDAIERVSTTVWTDLPPVFEAHAAGVTLVWKRLVTGRPSEYRPDFGERTHCESPKVTSIGARTENVCPMLTCHLLAGDSVASDSNPRNLYFHHAWRGYIWNSCLVRNEGDSPSRVRVPRTCHTLRVSLGSTIRSTQPMTTQDSSLGTCPSCNAAIPAGLALIEYERADRSAAFAECPDCREVVRPQ